jgi:hypothetical protein
MIGPDFASIREILFGLGIISFLKKVKIGNCFQKVAFENWSIVDWKWFDWTKLDSFRDSLSLPKTRRSPICQTELCSALWDRPRALTLGYFRSRVFVSRSRSLRFCRVRRRLCSGADKTGSPENPHFMMLIFSLLFLLSFFCEFWWQRLTA